MRFLCDPRWLSSQKIEKIRLSERISTRALGVFSEAGKPASIPEMLLVIHLDGALDVPGDPERDAEFDVDEPSDSGDDEDEAEAIEDAADADEDSDPIIVARDGKGIGDNAAGCSRL
jgi:hypothetical protein